MKNIFTTALTGDNLIVTPNGIKSVVSLKEGDLIVTDKGTLTLLHKEVYVGVSTTVIDRTSP